MSERIKSILDQLEQMREDLLALSDDIWLSIDHNDTQAMKQGVAFKESFNGKVAEFDKLSADLSVLVQQFTSISLNDEDSQDQQSPQSRDRAIVELDRYEPHSLDEDFTYKRPYGYRLGNIAQSNLKTWRRLYELICLYLAKRDPQTFAKLPDDPRFMGRRGNTYFTRKSDGLRFAIPLPQGIFAEVNLSSNHLRDQIKKLLEAFEIDYRELIIYLREDRDAAG